MIDQKTFAFLRGLEQNNSKDWLDDHRQDYEDVKSNLVTVAEHLIGEVSRFDDTIRRSHLDPAASLTRINRDMRFAKDKTPYKPEIFIMIKGTGDFQRVASYYMHIQPANCYAGGGIFRTERGPLGKIRERISSRLDEFRAAVESKQAKLIFPDGLQSPSKLKTQPRGVAKDDPAIEFLRFEGYCLNHPMTQKTMMEKGALKGATKALQAAAPLVKFLNAAVR